jgi:hypothetical protein
LENFTKFFQGMELQTPEPAKTLMRDEEGEDRDRDKDEKHREWRGFAPMSKPRP